jgi:hypothetical protein
MFFNTYASELQRNRGIFTPIVCGIRHENFYCYIGPAHGNTRGEDNIPRDELPEIRIVNPCRKASGEERHN